MGVYFLYFFVVVMVLFVSVSLFSKETRKGHGAGLVGIIWEELGKGNITEDI